MFSAKLQENLSEVLSENHGEVIIGFFTYIFLICLKIIIGFHLLKNVIGFLHTSVFICLKDTEKVNKPNNKTKIKMLQVY